MAARWRQIAAHGLNGLLPTAQELAEKIEDSYQGMPSGIP
jgi:hypothetical protein